MLPFIPEVTAVLAVISIYIKGVKFIFSCGLESGHKINYRFNGSIFLYPVQDLQIFFKHVMTAVSIIYNAYQKESDLKGRDEFYYGFLSVLDDALLPSLSVLHYNPCMAEEVWETIKLYPYTHRYISSTFIKVIQLIEAAHLRELYLKSMFA